VRSAREDDLELLWQFGRPAFAYSGATPHLLPFIHRARVVDLYAGLTSGYYRSPTRAAPHNLHAHPAQLIAGAHGASGRRMPTAPAPALGSSCVTAWPSRSAGPARTPIAARRSRRHRASR
jgi:Protein of unknown function (DUF3048) N-terminal domain